MTDNLSIAALGLLLGVRHALDPDHLVAVSTMAAHTRSMRRLAGIAASWGLGHSVTILLVGGVIVLFKVAVAPRVALAAEFLVALMLIGLGVANLRRGRTGAAHAHAHVHATDVPHAHDAGQPRMLRAAAVGMLHGLAGSAAIALIVVATVSDPRWALAYLAVFGLGTVVGMVGATLAVGAPALWVARRAEPVRHAFGMGAGVLSAALGLYLAFALLQQGLFAATVTYQPH